MRVLLLAVVLAAVVMAAKPKWHQLDGYTFAKYVEDFGKVYDSEAEFDHREALFNAELASVMAHNQKPGVMYKRGINHFSDRAEHELRRVRGLKRAETHEVVRALDAKNTRHEPTGMKLPKSFDLRNSVPPVLTAIKDQGDCGSCWAHAATEVMESSWYRATGDLFVLSQQQVAACVENPLQCGGIGGCNGATAEIAIDYVAQTGGITQEWQYGYSSYWGCLNATMGANCMTPACKPPTQKEFVAKFTGYTKAKENDKQSVMEMLVTKGPLAIGVDASKWSSYESGIFDNCPFNITQDHAVVLVGWGTDASLNADYWIVRNSWNAGWGEQGFIRLRRHTEAYCGWNVHNSQGSGCKGGPSKSWMCGECGLLFDAVHPNADV